MQHSVLTRQSGHTVHPDKVCLTVSCVYTHPVQGLASLRTLDYNSLLGSCDRGLHRVAHSRWGLCLHTRLVRVDEDIEIAQVPISHVDARKETRRFRIPNRVQDIALFESAKKHQISFEQSAIATNDYDVSLAPLKINH